MSKNTFSILLNHPVQIYYFPACCNTSLKLQYITLLLNNIFKPKPAALHQMEKLQMSSSVGLNNAWLCNIVTEVKVAAAALKTEKILNVLFPLQS